MPEKEIHLVLLAPDMALLNAFRAAFKAHPEVDVVSTKFEEYGNDWDCVITPGNSFGIMDGGFDKVVNDHFNKQVQNNVQVGIHLFHGGELPVGACYIARNLSRPGGGMQWGKSFCVAYAPTMRIPMEIRSTHNAYQAMFAALVAVTTNNNNQSGFTPRIRTVLCPGLGTATGKLSRPEAARQMAVAYAHWNRHKDAQKATFVSTWEQAKAWHDEIVGEGEK